MLLYKVNIFSSQSIPQANHMDFPIPSKERIDQIASWLSETPGHFGPTAADRTAFRAENDRADRHRDDLERNDGWHRSFR